MTRRRVHRGGGAGAAGGPPTAGDSAIAIRATRKHSPSTVPIPDKSRDVFTQGGFMLKGV